MKLNDDLITDKKEMRDFKEIFQLNKILSSEDYKNDEFTGNFFQFFILIQ